jgi:hypothetical protein
MLQANPDLTQREISQQLGTSGLNYCLKALIDKGLVKAHNFSQSKNKFGYIYVLTPQGLAEIAGLQAGAAIAKPGPSAHNSTEALN